MIIHVLELVKEIQSQAYLICNIIRRKQNCH